MTEAHENQNVNMLLFYITDIPFILPFLISILYYIH